MATEVTFRAIKSARFESEGFATDVRENADAFKLTIPVDRHVMPRDSEAFVFQPHEGVALMGVIQAAVRWLDDNRDQQTPERTTR